MKIRKTKDLQTTLTQKGFIPEPKKAHHVFYYLNIDGKKHNIYTYFSHGKSEYDKHLMQQLKKQLKFTETSSAEEFFDCPFTMEQYIEMLKENGDM
ncbi:MAG: hypothetical protein HW421_2866 [Ignavibacteria bacterium]|nr:hypothetical protein [Ignavibacteria bacterium]